VTERRGMKEKGFKPLPDGRWQASVWDGQTGKNIRRQFPSKSLAVKWRTEAQNKVLHGEHEASKRGGLRFSDAVDMFCDWSKTNLRPSTSKTDEGVMRRLKAHPIFANKKVEQITSLDIEHFKKDRMQNKSRHGNRDHDRPLSKRGVDYDIGRLKRLFTLLMDWGHCSKNPANKVKLFKEESAPVRILSNSEEKALLKACIPYLKDIVIFALNTGLRRKEIMELKRKQINLPNSSLFIPAYKAKGKKDRHIPLNESALKVLRRIKTSKEPEAYVFGNSNGTIQQNLERVWRRALKDSGVTGFRFHDLRHTFASRLVMKGVDLVALKELLGHADIKMTLRYAHLAAGHLLDAVRKLDPDLQKTCKKKKSRNPAAL
jgi:integrase